MPAERRGRTACSCSPRGPRAGACSAFRNAEAAQAACAAFTEELGYPVVEEWSDISHEMEGIILVRYYEWNAGGAKISEEQRIERYIVDGS